MLLVRLPFSIAAPLARRDAPLFFLCLIYIYIYINTHDSCKHIFVLLILVIVFSANKCHIRVFPVPSRPLGDDRQTLHSWLLPFQPLLLLHQSLTGTWSFSPSPHVTRSRLRCPPSAPLFRDRCFVAAPAPRQPCREMLVVSSNWLSIVF